MVDETRVSNETAAGPASTNAAYRIVLDAITTGSASIANSVVPSDRRLSLQPIPPLSSDEWTALGEAGGSILVDHDLATRKVKLRLVPGVVHNLAAGTLLINLDGAFQTLGIRGRVSDLGAKRKSVEDRLKRSTLTTLMQAYRLPRPEARKRTARLCRNPGCLVASTCRPSSSKWACRSIPTF